MAASPPERGTIIVGGLSPFSFSTELLSLWRLDSCASDCFPRLVWLNKHDSPPVLPDHLKWDEVHRIDAGNLDELNKIGSIEQWGNRLLVIMGAGLSFDATGMDYTKLKSGVRSSGEYLFDKESILDSLATADFFGDVEPLCVRLIRFSARIHEPFVRGDVPRFHQWLASQSHRLEGIITFNIDSLEYLALPKHLHSRICQLHGNLLSSIILGNMHRPLHERSVMSHPPPGWNSITVLAAISTGRASVVDLFLKPESEFCILDVKSREAAQQQETCAAKETEALTPTRRSSRVRSKVVVNRETAIRKLAGDDDVKCDDESVNVFIRSTLPGVCVGNLVFNGDAGHASVAKAAQNLLTGFCKGDRVVLERCYTAIEKMNADSGLEESLLSSNHFDGVG